VSSPVQEERHGRAAQRAAAQKAAAQKAAAERAASRRQTQAILGAAGGVIAVVLVVAFAVIVTRSGDDTKAANKPAASAPDQQQPDAQQPQQPAAPQQLPPGTDPALNTKPTVTKGDGNLTKLVVTPLVAGKGAPVKAGQTLTVNYVGISYTTGKQFESSWDKGGPADFRIGTGDVIPGWDQGLVGVNVGSRVQLDIPTELSFPDQSNSATSGPLRFVVDVLGAQ
jgi:peptidylprolyl isomerase